MKNRYLKLGYFFNRFLIGLGIAGFVIAVALILGHSTGFTNIVDWASISTDGDLTIHLLGSIEEGTEQPAGIVIFNIIKTLVMLSVLLYVFYLVEKVLRSVEDLRTFQVENIKNFKQMGICFLIIAIIDLIQFRMNLSGDVVTFGIDVNLGFIFSAIGALLLRR
jgi:hypothetical protein